MLGSLPLLIAGMCIFSTINSLLYLYITFALMGAGVAGLHTVTLSSTITNWFSEKQGLATGIAFAGIGFGGLTLAPLSGYLAIEFGWRTTYFVLAVLALVVILPLIWFLIKDKPEDIGTHPDGLSTFKNKNTSLAKSQVDLSLFSGVSTVLKTPSFWMATFSFFLINIGFFGVLTHQVSYFTDIGISPSKAAEALGYVAGFGILGKVGAGYLGDRMSKVLVGVLFFFFEGLSILFLIAQKPSLLWPFVIIFGICMGANVVIRPLVIWELFGPSFFGSTYGWAVFFSYFGLAIGAPFAGFIFDQTNSYHGAFVVFIFAYLAAVLLLLLSLYISKREKTEPYET
jgi:sugar phosphate permease